MYWDIEEVQSVAPRTLAIRFSDGLSGTLRIHESFCTGVFQALRDDHAVSEVRIEHGVLVWPNGLDLAPDRMYHEIKNNPNHHYELE
ncbi:MAG TPA: DUF2442 domain-containing protein [Geobacter sp.]|nr:DUF2442 domain-containing protein [Geobacter sp.]